MENIDYAKRVQELLKLPQTLCRQCGQCCDIAIFKGGLLYDEVIELINNSDTKESQIKGAKDFLSVFEPISVERAREINSKFVSDMLERTGKTEDEITFFHCRFVTEDKKCSNHENRPEFCRVYPVCYRNMYYFEGCGYAKQAQKNWAEVEEILKKLGGEDII